MELPLSRKSKGLVLDFSNFPRGGKWKRGTIGGGGENDWRFIYILIEIRIENHYRGGNFIDARSSFALSHYKVRGFVYELLVSFLDIFISPFFSCLEMIIDEKRD